MLLDSIKQVFRKKNKSKRYNKKCLMQASNGIYKQCDLVGKVRNQNKYKLIKIKLHYQQ